MLRSVAAVSLYVNEVAVAVLAQIAVFLEHDHARNPGEILRSHDFVIACARIAVSSFAMVERGIFVHEFLRYSQTFLKIFIGIHAGLMVFGPGSFAEKETAESSTAGIGSHAVVAVARAVANVGDGIFETFDDLVGDFLARSARTVGFLRGVGENAGDVGDVAIFVDKLHVPP